MVFCARIGIGAQLGCFGRGRFLHSLVSETMRWKICEYMANRALGRGVHCWEQRRCGVCSVVSGRGLSCLRPCPLRHWLGGAGGWGTTSTQPPSTHARQTQVSHPASAAQFQRKKAALRCFALLCSSPAVDPVAPHHLSDLPGAPVCRNKKRAGCCSYRTFRISWVREHIAPAVVQPQFVTSSLSRSTLRSTTTLAPRARSDTSCCLHRAASQRTILSTKQSASSLW
jgi:hypothetical protein